MTKQQTIRTNSKPIGASFSNNIDMGFCPVNQTTSHSITLVNNNSNDIKFEFEYSTFEFSPKKGTIAAKSQLQVNILYHPLEAIVQVASSILRCDNEPDTVIKTSAIGKYPFIGVNFKKFDFDKILVKTQKTKELVIKNSSQVPAKFFIHKIQDDDFNESIFTCDVQEALIPAKSSYLVKINYNPQLPNVISSAHFEIECVGGNKVDIECVGSSQGVDVVLSSQSLSFGEVRLNKQSSRVLLITNNSNLQTKFQFFTQQGNVFQFSKSRGTVEAQSQTRIMITFNPQNTINYYERVFCIIRNHIVSFVDLIGTCYDLLDKPLVLNQTHVDLFRHRVIMGKIKKIDFKYLENSMMTNRNTYQNPQSAEITHDLSLMEIPQEVFDRVENQTVLHKEIFLDIKSDHRLVQLNEELIDFGFASQMTVSGVREIVLTNRLPVKMSIFWTIQQESTDDDQQITAFNIFPQNATIKPNGSQRFDLTFRPGRSQAYYYQQLQYFAIKYDTKQTKETIDELKNTKRKTNLTSGFTVTKTNVGTEFVAGEMVPPIQGYIPCVGHSFSQGQQPFIPNVSCDVKKVVFPPCTVDESVYQTLEITNKTDTPTYFRFQKESSNIFRVYPENGLIEGKQFCLIVIEFKPDEPKLYNKQISCILNHSSSNPLKINLSGFCTSPALKIQNEGQIYFPPCYTGVFSRQKVKIQNISRIETQYMIQIPEKYQDEVFIEPKNGKLRPNESQQLECSFIPLKKHKYKVQVPIYLSDIINPDQRLIGYYKPGSGNLDDLNFQLDKRITTIQKNFEVIGAGGDGSLRLEPSLIDFGIVKINFNQKSYVTLENFSNVNFHVELQLKAKQTQDSKLDNRFNNLLQNCFSLDFKEGIIAANSKVEIGIVFNPIEACDLDIELECIATERTIQGVFTKQSVKKFTSSKCKMTIKGRGSYPNLKIVDVRNDSVSVATLWENFQLNKINKELENDLTQDEKSFLQLEKLSFTEVEELMHRLTAYDWNFGYLPINKNIKPRKIVITIQNVGGTELQWNFKLPSDSQIHVEHWADPGEPSEEELFEKAIIDRKIFDISPRGGTLAPGELADIQLIFSPGNELDLPYENSAILNKSNSEKFYLQVILQIVNGKPLVLRLKGRTLSPQEGYLALRNSEYQLPAVPIGLLVPVTFPIEVSNVGSANITYKADCFEIINNKKQKKDDSNFKIFDLQNPSGMISASDKSYIYCLFRPLEAKTYQFNISINVFDFYNKLIDTIEVNVLGSGYYGQIEDNQNKIKKILPSQRSQVSTLGSKVFFSIEEIDFGELEKGKTEHRIIILYNQSQTNKLNFKFKKTGLICGDELLLEPLSGELEAGQFIEIKLSLQSSLIPSIYEGEIECVVNWEQLGKYQSIQDGLQVFILYYF